MSRRSDAELYLPTPMDREGNPWTTVHLGPHDQQVPVHLTMFSSRRIGGSLAPCTAHTA
jgi:hypothetical protein